MLRALLAALVLANAVYFAFSQGWLDGLLDTRSQGEREPDRVKRQVRPDAVRLLPPPAASGTAP